MFKQVVHNILNCKIYSLTQLIVIIRINPHPANMKNMESS